MANWFGHSRRGCFLGALLLLLGLGSFGQELSQIQQGKGLFWSGENGQWSVRADAFGTTWQAGKASDQTLLTIGWVEQTVESETLLVQNTLLRLGPAVQQKVSIRIDGVGLAFHVTQELPSQCLDIPLKSAYLPIWYSPNQLGFGGEEAVTRLKVVGQSPKGSMDLEILWLPDEPGQRDHILRICPEQMMAVWRVDVYLEAKVSDPQSVIFPLMVEDCTNTIDDDMDTLADCLDPDCQTVDGDNDGVLLCAPDCDDNNENLWSQPTLISDLSLASGGGLSWSAPGDGGGNTVVYDLLRSLDPGDFSGAACIELDDTDLTASDPSQPTAGQLFSYLLRTQNACPEQTLGQNSGGLQRISNACQEDCGVAGDDDGDGDVDCADFDCIGSASCPEICDDGYDNDGDGDTDCNDSDCAADGACLVCDLDGIHEVANAEECDDGGLCDYDGCSSGGCDREDTVIFDSFQFNTTGGGFDLDNADGDNDIYTGIDNFLGGSALLVGQLNPLLTDSLNDGSLRGAVTFSGLDSLTDDSDVIASMHAPIDPICPAIPVYDAANLPAWLGAPPAQMYSDSGQFPVCVAQSLITEGDSIANGLYPTSSAGQPPAPFFHLQADPILMGGFTLHRGVFEATAINDGASITGLSNGLGGGVLPARDLWQLPGSGALCPTALHAVLGLAGQPDIDLDPAPGGTDTISYSLVGFPIVACGFNQVDIGDCLDAETGATIVDSDLNGNGTIEDGECVLDPRMGDGYSAAFDFSAIEVHIVESRDFLTYCP